MRGLSWRNFDFLLLGAVVLASAFGVMMIRSAIAGNEELLPLGTRQIYFVIIGVAVQATGKGKFLGSGIAGMTLLALN